MDKIFPRTVTKDVETDNGYLTTEEIFDGLNRPIRTVTSGISENIITKQFYDNMGRNYRTEGPYDNTSNCPYTLTEYFNDGRIEKITTNAGTTNYAYDGYTTTITDPDGNKRTETSDHLGLLRSVELEGGGTTGYDYTAVGINFGRSSP